jgi:uncharacterized iron-regulated membrane protein
MRPFWILVHRWLGLLAAGFLFITGLTGAVISWDEELDHVLNADLTAARASGPALPALELARQVELRHPEVRVTYLPLTAEPGESLEIVVDPRVDPATGRLFEPGFNEVFVDPASGEELGVREWGAVWPITRATFVSFLYRLHYSLQIPEMAGIDTWGEWLLGSIALIWTIDCFVGFYLTLPARRAARLAGDDIADDRPVAVDRPVAAPSFWRRWKPAWRVRWSGGKTRLNFDLHRAFSLWTWLLLFILAFTAFSLNLYREVFFPAMSVISKVTPSPFDLREPADEDHPIEPRLDYADIVALAQAEAARRGWAIPVGALSYSPEFGVYEAFLFDKDDEEGGVGPPRLYFDGLSGELLGDLQPWKGTAADIFVQAQFPLHSGRILGLPGRILISALGLVAAMLSVTGVYIWWKKRAARKAAAWRGGRQRGAVAAAPME